MTIKRGLSVVILFCLLMPASLLSTSAHRERGTSNNCDIGGTVAVNEPNNVTIIVEVMRARLMTVEGDEPEFNFSVYINGENSAWWDDIYKGTDIWLEGPVAARTIPYNPDELVSIQIQMWGKSQIRKFQGDLSRGANPLMDSKTINLVYDIKSGEWTGDDYLGDGNGYGHCSGFEDGNYDENDCEIWFDISQGSGEEWWHGGDRLTYWEKVNVYHLDPSKDYSGVDFNEDGIPIEWEDEYGFDPFAKNNISEEDPDRDGLTNLEEYKTSQWLSDPFAQNIFIEVDGMQGKYPRSKPYEFPKESQYLLCNVFAKHNITVIIDDGILLGGGDLIRFNEGMSGKELEVARLKYFLNEDEHNWKCGIFHYALICCQMEWYGRPAGGRMFASDSLCIGGQYIRNWAWAFYFQNSSYYKAFASGFMHELGHTIGLDDDSGFEGVDNESTRFPWNIGYWKWGPYESCMNYRYVYKMVDYSNGDDETYDQNDWEALDLTLFNENWR